MNLAIGSTRVGLTLKAAIIECLEGLGHTVDDLGMKEDGPFVAYFEAAANVARAVAAGECDKGIIICGTGAGSVITANKFQGIHAAVAGTEFEGNRAAAINGANVLCLGEWLTPPKHAEKIVRAWLDTEFGEGFEPEWKEFLKNARDQIGCIEQENFK